VGLALSGLLLGVIEGGARVVSRGFGGLICVGGVCWLLVNGELVGGGRWVRMGMVGCRGVMVRVLSMDIREWRVGVVVQSIRGVAGGCSWEGVCDVVLDESGEGLE